MNPTQARTSLRQLIPGGVATVVATAAVLTAVAGCASHTEPASATGASPSASVATTGASSPGSSVPGSSASASPKAAGSSVTTPAVTSAVPPARAVTSQMYGVSISIPASWQPTPYMGSGRFAYDGTSGWVELNAETEPSGLRQACTSLATANVLHPYGLHPLIRYRSINGRPGCLILPSSDAPAQPHRAGGPAFQSSEALIEYRQPIRIGSVTYPLLEVYADPAHLVAIVDSIQLHH